MRNETESRVYEFGKFRVYPVHRVLLCDGKPITLAPKSFDLLSVLVQHHGKLLNKEFLLEAVWSDAAVEENSIAKAVSEIRKALGDTSKSPRFIATIAKHGYRFLPKVIVRSGPLTAVTAPSTAELRIAGARVTSLAVLPFIWLTPITSDTLLGVGMADALITKLSSLPQIVVRPTASILKYTAAHRDPVSIATEMGVDFVLSGSLQQIDDRLRLTIQMVTPDQKRCVWADSFEARFTSLFEVEDSVSSRVANALALKLTPAQKQLLGRRNTSDGEAYRAYLRGRYFWSEQTFTSALKAIDCFRESLALDPNYSVAWAGMADSYVLIGVSGALTGGLPADQIWPHAKNASLRAIALDDSQTEAHAALGFINFFYEHDEQAAHREFDRALALQPHYASAHHGRSLAFGFSGKHDAALEAIEQAIAIEPLSPIFNANKGYLLYIAHRYDDAVAQLRNAIALDETFAATHYRLSLPLIAQRDYENATQHLEKALELSNESPHVLGALGYIYGLTKQEDRAKEILARLNRLARTRHVSDATFAEVQVGLRDYDNAGISLNRAVQNRAPALIAFRVDPRYEELRALPRFADLLLQHE